MSVGLSLRVCRRYCGAGGQKSFFSSKTNCNKNYCFLKNANDKKVKLEVQGVGSLKLFRGYYKLAIDYEYLAPVPEIKVPIIWVLGGPGSGKGTQCDRIVEKYGFTHLSSGDLLRAEVASGSPRGKELTAIMERGELVPMEIVLDLLREAIIKALPTSRGFLIDGYPREKEQGILFEQNIAPVSMVLFFDASENTLVERLLGRAKTSGRVDDNEETIKKRLYTFNTHNDQVIEQYVDKLKRINAERNVEDIFSEVTSYLDPLLE